MGHLVSRSQSRKTSFLSCICKENLKMAIQYYAFAIVALAATASALKCYQGAGTVADGTLKLTECADGFDRCVNVTTSGVLGWSCNKESVLTPAGSKVTSALKFSQSKRVSARPKVATLPQ